MKKKVSEEGKKQRTLNISLRINLKKFWRHFVYIGTKVQIILRLEENFFGGRGVLQTCMVLFATL